MVKEVGNGGGRFLHILFGWLALLTLGLWAITLHIKFSDFISRNVNAFLIVTSFLLLVFWSMKVITGSKIKNRVVGEMPR